MKHKFLVEYLATPIGEMRILTDEADRLRVVDWDDLEDRMYRLLRLHYGEGAVTLHAATRRSAAFDALEAYFSGDKTKIGDLSIKTSGTEFQTAVWKELYRIPVGTTVSYGEIAARIGRPSATRAVGLANGANPVNVVVPCHRVIGSNKSLTGYGSGLHRKRWLLEYEAEQRDLFLAARR